MRNSKLLSVSSTSTMLAILNVTDLRDVTSHWYEDWTTEVLRDTSPSLNLIKCTKISAKLIIIIKKRFFYFSRLLNYRIVDIRVWLTYSFGHRGLEYDRALSISLSSKTRESRKWARVWLRAGDREEGEKERDYYQKALVNYPSW